MSIFERKPRTDFCDSCGIDAAEYGRLLNEVAQLTKQRAAIETAGEARQIDNQALRARITELEGALRKIELDGGDNNAFSQWAVPLARAALSQEKK